MINEQKKILNRLKRARGQLEAVIRVVEEGGNCRDVVTQLSAVSTALDRAGFAIISTALEYCVSPETERADSGDTFLADKHMTKEELEKLFLMLA